MVRPSEVERSMSPWTVANTLAAEFARLREAAF
jgi:hypothetical protein